MSNQDDSKESFAELLDAQPTTPGDVRIRPGDKVKGKVVLITPDAIYLDYGGKSEGWADRAEFTDEAGTTLLQMDQEVELTVIEFTPAGPHFGKSLRKTKDSAGWDMLSSAFESGVPVEGEVASVNKGGYAVHFGGVRAFCPMSQIDLRFCDNPSVFLGTTQKFKVIEFEEEDEESGNLGRIVVSRRAVLEAEQALLKAETMKRLAVGEDFDATITRLVEFGAFADLGGVEGLIHVSEISREGVAHPSAKLAPGQTVRVRVTKVGTDEKGRDRISLSMKALEPDPWAVSLSFAAGDTVTGTVKRLASFGAFIELAPGLEGLVHISEIARKHVANPADELSEGQSVTAKVLDIDIERRRISLSIRETLEPPVALEPAEETRKGDVIRRRAERNAPAEEGDARASATELNAAFEAESATPKAEPVRFDTPHVGLVTKGLVNGIMPYGIFVDLPKCGARVRGLMHNSEISAVDSKDPQQGLKEGEEIEVEIIRIDDKGRISLSRKSIFIRQEREELSRFMNQGGGKIKLGSLADKLKGLKLDK